MNTTKEQQKELDDALVAPENLLKIGKSNLRLSSNLKSKEPTLQVVLDALKLTPFYNAFEISADVPKIHARVLDMLKICPKLPGQKFEEPLLEEDILSFIRDLGHTGEIKFLSNVNVNHMHKPWRSFAAIINKCLSGKTTALESLCLSRAQILWGMYHNKKVDYVYLLWEDLVFQVENKNSKKNSTMYYPRFTKVIVDYFMAKDEEIPRRSKMFWHYARDDFMFTTIRVISKHKDTQEYGAILPQHLTNQAMLESEAFKTYRAYATGEKAPKSKATKKKTDSESSPKTKPSQASKGKRIKTSAKGDKPTSKSKGLTVLSEVAFSEAEQMKLATKRSLKEFHISHASGSGDGVDILSKVPDEQQQTESGTNEGAGDKPEVPDVPEYRSESEEESWTFSQGEDEEEDEEHDSDDDNDDEDDVQEHDSQRTESDDSGDDFVHPNLSTYKADEEEQEKEEEKAEDDDEVISDQKVSTPPDYELTEEDENQQDDDTMGGEQEDEEDEELYGDLNINLNRRDAEMTDAQINQETEEAHVTLTTEPPVVQQQSSYVSSDLVAKFINPSSDTGIDSLLNQNVAVSVTPSSDTTIPQPPILIIQPQQQTHVSTTTTTISTTTLPEIPNFASLFGFDRKVSSLEIELSEIKQSNQFAAAVASIPGILREEAQAENQDFLNSLDSNMKRIIKEQVKAKTSKIMTKVKKYVTETLGAEVKINLLTDLVQKNLYRALLEAYNSDKDLLSSYGEVVTLKRGRDDQDKDEEPSAGLNRGSKQRRSGKEESSRETTQKASKSTSSSKGATRSPPKSSVKSNQEEEHEPKVADLEEPLHQEFDTGNDVSPWMTKLAQASSTTSSFNEFLATPIDFFAFMMNRLNIQNLTQDLLAGPTYDLIKGTCKSVVELEYHLEEVFKATNDQLDWHNPKGRPYPHDLSKPLPLIPDARGRQIIPYDHFINSDLEYLKGGSSSRKYTTSITKTKHAYWGTYHWGPKHQRFYGYATNMEISKEVYSKDRIIVVTSLEIMEFFGYTHLEEIIGKLTNLNVDERFALNVALRMYTRRIVIQERVEDLQLAVESYQKKINLTKPDTYRSDISKKTPYTAYRDIQGIIYQDDMDKNRLMRTDELHKFSDGTLNHVRTSLNDIATRIQMEYLPKRKWSKQDKQRARVMIKAIDKKLKDMRSNLVDPHRFEGNLKMVVKRQSIKVKEFQRSFRHSDTERLSRSEEVLKLKNFKKDKTLKLFKSSKSRKV
ncbi:hypothetical protein Tco_0802114 [Tanacetum coccineum]|uniref:Uncharacterized protein n=1 Tax=Tanacetum coccineum TaxID=301880 RepID=A0ABQ5A0M3_9ASTR